MARPAKSLRAQQEAKRELRSPFYLVLALGLLAPQTMAEEAVEITASAWDQIAAVSRMKRGRTAVQRKLDTRLVVEILRQRNDSALNSLPALRTGIESSVTGKVLVDLRAEVDDSLLRAIVAANGEVVNQFPAFRSVRARLPLGRIEELAARAEVESIRVADVLRTEGNTVITEGDTAHRADVARTVSGLDGSGVTTCAMSDSVDALASLQATGELPPGVGVLAGQSGNPGSSEGTALLEIIHDMAPGADLMFATGKGGQAQMAQNILDLAAAGCNIIVDDVFYFGEPPFQDGVIAQAVDQVSGGGVIYFSSAGNSGRLNAGTSGVWEGDFVAAATLPPPLSGAALAAHDFGGSLVGNQLTEQSLNDAPFFTLWWSNPLAGAGDDYDLFLLDDALANVVAFSANTQDGNDDPFEIIDSQGLDHSGNRLVITKFSGNDQFLHLNTHRGLLQVGTNGQITGHAGAESAIAVAAVNVSTAGGGAFTGGPANPVEPFSSDGPRRIFFLPNGSPALQESGTARERGPTFISRAKPNITAADGVSTTTPGFTTFFGTSASAPHAAGKTSLLFQRFPNGMVRDLLKSSALDIEDPFFDFDSGDGLPMADIAIEAGIFTDGFESGNTASWN